MMHVVICEDESYYQEAIVRAITNWSLSSEHHDIRCSVFCSSEDLLERWEKGMHIDLLFLDIEIPKELNGMALAQEIRLSEPHLPIVFVTNYDNYVYEGYTVNALRYLRKPIKESEIFSCMESVYQHFQLLTNDRIMINYSDQHFALRYSEIIFIEAQAHYLSFHLGTIEKIPKVRATINQVIQSLPSELFVQCHRSYIVNLLYIHRFTKELIFLSNGQSIPVSKTNFFKLHTAFNQFYEGMKI